MNEIIEKDAARYRWWRENIGLIQLDGDGISGVAFSCHIPIKDIQLKTEAELMDMVADIYLQSNAAPSCAAGAADMSTAKHTPWRWQRSELYENLIVAADGYSKRRDICDLIDNDNADADAALITAAPELLAAAKFMSQVFSEKADNQTFKDGLEMLRDAIAKAEGGEA